MHILSPETDNCPSCISGRGRMTVENISWSISMKQCCRPRRGLNPRPPGLQSDGASNWATEAGWTNSKWQPAWIYDRHDFSYFWSTSHPNASYQVSSQLAFRFRRRSQKIDFQDGGHLGYPIGRILAIFDLQVTPMSPTKFGVNWPFGAGAMVAILDLPSARF